jgi:hypothetical protein
MTPEAALLAEALRAAKKVKALSGTQIAEQIERLTGSRPSLMWVSRRLHGQINPVLLPELPADVDLMAGACSHCGKRTIWVDPMLGALADVLDVDLTRPFDAGTRT